MPSAVLENTTTLLAQLPITHDQWVALCAAVINLLVRLLKMENPPAWMTRIPPKMRPLVAVALGQLSAAIGGLVVPGVTPGRAIAGGFVSAALAVLLHDGLVEALRGGREVGQKATSKDNENTNAEKTP